MMSMLVTLSSAQRNKTFISYDLYQKIIGHCIKNGLICPIVDLIPEAFDLLYDVPITDYVGTLRCNMQLEYSHSPIEVEMLITSEPRNIIGLALQCKLPIMELISDCSSSSITSEHVSSSSEATTPPTDDQQSTIMDYSVVVGSDSSCMPLADNNDTTAGGDEVSATTPSSRASVLPDEMVEDFRLPLQEP